MPLTLPNVYAFILFKLQMALMGFSTPGAAFYTETEHECTYSQLYGVRNAWYMIP